MSTNVLVSLILPIYNSEEHLAQTIDSVLNQSHKEIEVLLIDDGSIDKSLDICKHYKTLDNRVRIFAKENQGVSVARNIGLKAASGKYIRFIDSDDILPKHSTSKLVEAAEKHNSQIVIGGYEENICYKKDNNRIKRFLENENVFSTEDFASNYVMLKKKKMINALWNKLYCCRLIKENNILFDSDLTLGEDLIFNLSVLRRSKKINTIEDVVYIYFIRNGFSLSQKYYSNRYYIYRRLQEAEKEYAEEFDVDIKEYLITNKMNEGIYQIESIMQNKKIPNQDKRRLLFQTKNEWGLHVQYKNYEFSRYNSIILLLLRLNQFYVITIICKLKGIYKALI
ncbi:glycosyltransferase family 2 protein [Neobacillus sp. FSL H8-0543]|uniref:glycosyltransferase family 2 protein n=1 Tax=Neobacillus sp. FSL H8-0543 TaxID=2954672 RepID=UPI0031585935